MADKLHRQPSAGGAAPARRVRVVPPSETRARLAPPLGPPIATGPFAAFASADYRLLYQGTVLTQGANWMQQVAQQWLLYSLTSSPFYLGLVGFARASPMLVISPFAGVLADRFDRRRVMVLSQLFAAAVAIWQWAIVFFNVVEPWQVLLAALLTGCAMAVNGPARQSIIPNLVERPQLTSAIALNSAGQNATRVVGPTLAGALIQIVDLSVCFLLQAGCLVWSLVTAWQLRLPPGPSRARQSSALANLGEGVRYVAGTPLIAALVWLAAIPSVFSYTYLSLLPVFAREVLAGSSSTLGLLMAANGLGAVVGSVGIAVFGDRLPRGRVILILAVGYSLMLALFALSTSLPLSFAMLALGGCSGSAFNSLTNTILNESVPDELRGRVMSLYMLTWGLMPLGALPSGALAEVIGAPLTVVLSNAVNAVLLVLLAVRYPMLWQAR